jgi:hypothetical protein
MARIPKTNVRKKTTKNIDKQRVVEIMRANINPKTNNPNYSKVSNLTGYDRKTLASWWGKRDKIASSMNKNSRQKLSSEKYKGMFPDMEDKLDEWTQELREAGCCVSGFTLKVKAIQILRELAQYNRTFSASDGWLRGFLRRKNFTLRRITTTGRDLPSDFLERATRRLRTMKTKSNWTNMESVASVEGRLTKKKMMKKLIKESQKNLRQF